MLAYPASPPGYVVEQDTNNWFTYSTELRLQGAGLTNGAARSLDLRFLRLEFLFDFRVYSGPATGWLRRPPSEFGWTCWYVQSIGPVMDGKNLCNSTVVTVMAPDNAEEVYGTPDDDGAPAKVVFTFTSGRLCSGCTLVGGQGGVFGSYHHTFFMPLNPTGMVLKGISCTDANAGGSVSYDPPAPSPPPAPLPPPSPPPPSPPLPPRAAQIPTWFAAGTAAADSSSNVRTAQTLSTSSASGLGVGSTGPAATACPWWRANQCANAQG